MNFYDDMIDFERRKVYVWLVDGISKNLNKNYENINTIQAEFLVREKRRILKKIYGEINNNFIVKHEKYDHVKYCSNYSHCMVMNLTKNEIIDILKDPDVSRISLYKDKMLVPKLSDIIMKQTGTDSVNGTQSVKFNDGNGFLGGLVKIGIISAANLKYILADAQIRGLEESGGLVYLGGDTAVVPSIHSSAIVSLIIGKSFEVNGVEYIGVVPRSTAYFVPTFSVIEVYKAIEKCIESGATAVNYSAGEAFADGEYNDFDRQIDLLIYNIGFSFITVSGNSRKVSSPGSAYNAITVGNAETKTTALTPARTPYEVFYKTDDNCSGFEQKEYLANKPDLVAPGRFIHYINARDEISFDSYGTSFACPYVTGVAAQIMQKYPEAKLNPLITKALLLTSANSNIISEKENPLVLDSQILRKKSGAGFLDAIAALGDITYYVGSIKIGTPSTYYGEYKITLKIGQKTRVLLYSEKSTNEIITEIYKNSIVLTLYDKDDNVLTYSLSPRENVKIIEYMANYTGDYTIRYYLSDFVQGTEKIPFIITWLTT